MAKKSNKENIKKENTKVTKETESDKIANEIIDAEKEEEIRKVELKSMDDLRPNSAKESKKESDNNEKDDSKNKETNKDDKTKENKETETNTDNESKVNEDDYKVKKELLEEKIIKYFGNDDDSFLKYADEYFELIICKFVTPIKKGDMNNILSLLSEDIEEFTDEIDNITDEISGTIKNLSDSLHEEVEIKIQKLFIKNYTLAKLKNYDKTTITMITTIINLTIEEDVIENNTIYSLLTNIFDEDICPDYLYVFENLLGDLETPLKETNIKNKNEFRLVVRQCFEYYSLIVSENKATLPSEKMSNEIKKCNLETSLDMLLSKRQ